MTLEDTIKDLRNVARAHEGERGREREGRTSVTGFGAREPARSSSPRAVLTAQLWMPQPLSSTVDGSLVTTRGHRPSATQ